MFSREVIQQTCILANKYGLPADVSLGTIETESSGIYAAAVSFKDWDGKQRDGVLPPIRLEGHYAKDGLAHDPVKLKAAIKAGVAGDYKAVKNPTSQSARYEMFVKLWKIDPQVAVESCSWGLGQVMGKHWSKLGYASWREFFDAMINGGVVAQLDVMFRYFKNMGTAQWMKVRNFDKVAENYNGSNYKAGGYQITIARNTAKWATYIAHEGGVAAIIAGKGASSQQPVTATPPSLTIGAKGAAVKTLQRNLVMVAVDGVSKAYMSDTAKKWQVILDLLQHDDGIYGPNTANSVKQFQYIWGQSVTGDYNDATKLALEGIIKGWSVGDAQSLDNAATAHFNGNKEDRKAVVQAAKTSDQPTTQPVFPQPITKPEEPVTPPAPPTPPQPAPGLKPAIQQPLPHDEPVYDEPAEKGKKTGIVAVVGALAAGAVIFWHHLVDAFHSATAWVGSFF